MNETLKKQVDDASYAFYDNSIYKIVKVTPKLNKFIVAIILYFFLLKKKICT